MSTDQVSPAATSAIKIPPVSIMNRSDQTSPPKAAAHAHDDDEPGAGPELTTLEADILQIFDSVQLNSTIPIDQLKSLKLTSLHSLIALLSNSGHFSSHQRNLLLFHIEMFEMKFLLFFDEFKRKLELWRDWQNVIASASAASDESVISIENFTKALEKLKFLAPEFDAEKFELIEAMRVGLLETIIRLMEENWEELFAICTTSDAKRISKAERNADGLNSTNLVYGEISFDSLAAILWRIDDPLVNPPLSLAPSENSPDFNLPRVFVDLGSGSGRAILAASSILNFSEFLGIEILKGLHETALTVSSRFRNEFLSSNRIPAHRKNQQFRFERDSFLTFDWSHADVVLANSTCFEDELMNEIGLRAAKLRVGSYFISLTKRINSPAFKLISSTQYNMSWGIATVHIHKRVEKSQ